VFNPYLRDAARVISLLLVPMVIVALLLSVIVPAFEMGRVMRLLSEIREIVGPVPEVSYRLEHVAGHERQSLFINAVLVVVALAAIAAVVSFSIRERRLAAILRRRVDEESAMARMARMLSEATSVDEAVERILAGTTGAMHGVGAYVEIRSREDRSFQSAALMRGGSVVSMGIHEGLPIPLMDDARTEIDPGVPYELDGIDWRLPPQLTPECVHCTGLVAPLLAAGELIGVLVLLRDARAAVFTENERRQLRLIADLATAVIRRLQVERKALLEIELRATSEIALREAAEALAGAFTVDDVTQQIAQSALDATEACGAFVEIIDSARDGSDFLVVRGVAGIDAPLMGATRGYAGSFTEQAIGSDDPAVATSLSAAYPAVSTRSLSVESSPTMVLPISNSKAPVAALFIIGTGRDQFSPEDTRRARTIAHLATLAYEKVRLLDEARDGRDELERVMKSRQRLMRGFSHDVKNPLGAADGYADLLSAGIYGELSDDQRESLQRMRRSIRRALDLIDDLHELARAETGTVEIRSELVDLGRLVTSSGDEYRGAADAAGLPLTVSVAEDLPLVETDGVRIQQIVGNLISNAIKYTKTGAINLRVRKYPSRFIRSVPARIDIEVADTGIGIPFDKHDQIFEEFSRLSTSDRPGAGLGLAISKRLAEALGGQILVNSEVDRGSTFTLRIPLEAHSRTGGRSVVPASTIGSLSRREPIVGRLATT
jgi:signal transduction histidine kinase